MKQLLVFILLVLISSSSCKRRHVYCICKTGPNANPNAKPREDLGKRNSINNFKVAKKQCKDNEKNGYEDCVLYTE